MPAFTGACAVDLPVPCDPDPTLAPTKYFDALEGGDAAVRFLFSGSVFYEPPGGGLQVAPIPWEKEAVFRLPVAALREGAAP